MRCVSETNKKEAENRHLRKCDRSISLVRVYSDLPRSQLTRVGSSRTGVTARMALDKSRDNHQMLLHSLDSC
jgi:hypothetical protein